MQLSQVFPPPRAMTNISRTVADVLQSPRLWPNASNIHLRQLRIQTPFCLRVRTAHTSANRRVPLHLLRFSGRRAALSFTSASSTSRAFFRTSRRWNSTNPPPSKPLSFSERMRKLSREYGWSALGVYLFLSALDFPFCFAAVRLLGVERVGHYEEVVVRSVKSFVAPIWGSNKDKSAENPDGNMAVESGIGATAIDHGVMDSEGSTVGKGASMSSIRNVLLTSYSGE